MVKYLKVLMQNKYEDPFLYLIFDPLHMAARRQKEYKISLMIECQPSIQSIFFVNNDGRLQLFHLLQIKYEQNENSEKEYLIQLFGLLLHDVHRNMLMRQQQSLLDSSKKVHESESKALKRAQQTL